MKPIQSGFRAAARLVNEWQDTLLYSGLGALVVVETTLKLAQGHAHVSDMALIAANTLRLVTIREIVRGFVWGLKKPEPRIVGDTSVPPDHIKNLVATFFVMSISSYLKAQLYRISGDVSSDNGLVFSLCGIMLFGAALFTRGALPHDIPDLYFNKDYGMWDYARRGNKNGPTQTEKLKKGFSDFGRRLVAGLGRPLPAPVAVRIHVCRNHGPV